MIYGTRLQREAIRQLEGQQTELIIYRLLDESDLSLLNELLENQELDQVQYFKPHSFDLISLKRVFKNPSFIMMGAFKGNSLAGYFFLRCLINRRCFIGRLVDKKYQRQGIAGRMSDIMYHTAWNSGFRCLTTISKNNKAIYELHEREGNTQLIRKLPDNYVLVEIKPS